MNQISVNSSIDGQCTETQDATGVRHSYPWRTFLDIFYKCVIFVLLLFVLSILMYILMTDNIHIKMLCYNIGATVTNNQRSRNSEHTDENETNGENMVQSSEHDRDIMCT